MLLLSCLISQINENSFFGLSSCTLHCEPGVYIWFEQAISYIIVINEVISDMGTTIDSSPDFNHWQQFNLAQLDKLS